MRGLYEFADAALPWIAVGILLALFFAGSARRKKAEEKKEKGDDKQ